jgi:hypothetical protein
LTDSLHGADEVGAVLTFLVAVEEKLRPNDSLPVKDENARVGKSGKSFGSARGFLVEDAECVKGLAAPQIRT